MKKSEFDIKFNELNKNLSLKHKEILTSQLQKISNNPLNIAEAIGESYVECIQYSKDLIYQCILELNLLEDD